MRVRDLGVCISMVIILAIPLPAGAQERPNPAELMRAQRDAMAVLSRMDGVWRGPAWTILGDGRKHEITQTERIGPFLGGTVKVIEGRGYDPDGKVTFNAFGIVSYDAATRGYSMRSYAMGQAGDFVLEPTADGYVWKIPAGPMTIRYTAVIKDGAWREIGERLVPGKDPVQFFEMNLKRVGDSEWPGAGAIPLK